VLKPEQSQIIESIRSLAKSILLPRFAQVSQDYKADGSIVTEADLEMQAAVEGFLKTNWPEIPLLGEEMTQAEQQRLLENSEYLWCLDPLDGTSNFAAGIPYFCTSLALIKQGVCELAIIYDPIRDECFVAQQGQGASLNDTALAPQSTAKALDKAIAFVDLKRLPARLAASLAAEPPFASQRNFGSGALDWAWLAAGRFHYYLHGGQKLWDYIAGELILRESGGYATTLEGQAVPVNQLVPRSVVASTNPEAQQVWMAEVRGRL